jgi:hypothetical protein
VTLQPLPEPPFDLAQRELALTELSDSLFRTHSIHRTPFSTGLAGLNRFDSPDKKYKVLYLGRDPYCAFIETFAHAAGTRVVTTDALKSRALAELKPSGALLVVDLTASGSLFRIGADSRLFSAEYAVSQQWSKALHDHPASVHGILYPSRLDPARHSVALFLDRGAKLVELSRQSWYAHGQQRVLLVEIIEHYKIELVETSYRVSKKPPTRARQGGFFE